MGAPCKSASAGRSSIGGIIDRSLEELLSLRSGPRGYGGYVKDRNVVQGGTLVGRYFGKFSGAGESIGDSVLSLPRVRNEGHWWQCKVSCWANSGQDRRTT